MPIVSATAPTERKSLITAEPPPDMDDSFWHALVTSAPTTLADTLGAVTRSLSLGVIQPKHIPIIRDVMKYATPEERKSRLRKWVEFGAIELPLGFVSPLSKPLGMLGKAVARGVGATGRIAAPAVQGATEGAALGATQGGMEMVHGEGSLGSTAKQALGGALLGGAFGAAGGKLTSLATRTPKPQAAPSLITPTPPSAIRAKFNNVTQQVRNGFLNAFAPDLVSEHSQRVAGVIRQNDAEMHLALAQAENTLKSARSVFAKMAQPLRWAFVDVMELGGHQPTPELQGIADSIRTVLDSRKNTLIAMKKLKTYYADYFPHIWKDPAKAKDAVTQFFSKRPMRGRQEFLKQRTHMYVADGLDAGLVPVSENPIDLVLLKLQSLDKAIMGERVKREMINTGMAKFIRNGQRGPKGWEPLPDPMFEARPQVTLQNGKKVFVKTGQYYGPAEVGKLINNYLSPGLRNSQIYSLARAVGNSLNMFQLGYSTYHAFTTMFNSMASDLALGIRGKQLAPTVRGLIPGASLVRDYFHGTKLLREAMKPGTQGGHFATMLDALTTGGGRTGMDNFYRTMDNVHAASRLKDAWAKRQWGKLSLYTLPATAELASIPIMQKLVPRVKMGAFMHLAELELQKLPSGSGIDDIRKVLGSAWDSIENRFGQLTYNNLFWNARMRDALMLTVRSVGWNLGTLREVGGGLAAGLKAGGRMVRLHRPTLTSTEFNKLAYTASLAIVTAWTGAVYQFLRTGEEPKEGRDLYFPRTGVTNPDGTAERHQLPTYMKEIFNISQHPIRTVANKLHPEISAAYDMLTNEDFYGGAIYDPTDPITTKMWDLGTYGLKLFEPLQARNLFGGENAAVGSGAWSLLGVTRAPKYAEMEPEQYDNYLRSLYRRQLMKRLRSKGQ